MWCTDYRLSDRWWNEPLLNIVAAAAQMSSLTHVEIAIGEEVGSNGMMSNVCRVFNDSVGVVRRQAPLAPAGPATHALGRLRRSWSSARGETRNTRARPSNRARPFPAAENIASVCRSTRALAARKRR